MGRFRAKEPFSCYSHLLGLVLAIPGLVVLIVAANGDPWRVAGFSLFGAGMILLYSASTIYHFLPVSGALEDRLKRFDHVAIFVLIAGTYSPVCLVILRDGWGWWLFTVVWAIALLGAIVKMFLPHLPRWGTAGIYLGMGWLGVTAAAPMIAAVPVAGLAWLVAGGLLYTAGAVIYGMERPDPFPNVFGFHEIFHVATLGGTASHFTFMLLYVAPVAG